MSNDRLGQKPTQDDQVVNGSPSKFISR